MGFLYAGEYASIEKKTSLGTPWPVSFSRFVLMTDEFFSDKLSFPFILTSHLSTSFFAVEGKMLTRGSSAALNFSRMEQKAKAEFRR